MQYAQIPAIVSADLARMIATCGLQAEQVRKKDIIKCLKALKVSESSEILSLRRKDDLWMQLLLASAL